MAFIRRSVLNMSEEDKRENEVREARDVNGAIEYAQKYAILVNSQTTFDETAIFNGIKAVGWLMEANTFCPDGAELSELIDLDDFFQSFSKLHCAFPFSEKASPLLPALIRNTTIVELDLSQKAYDLSSAFFRFANESFSKYIAETKSLKKLNISERQMGEHIHGLKQEEIQRIAGGLKTNSSIEELHLQGQPLCDAGLIIILDALASNPHTKISKLNILNTSITDAGATRLLNFLKKNKTVSSIDLISETDTEGNQYELTLVTENTLPVKGTINLLITSNCWSKDWIELSFIGDHGNIMKIGKPNGHKLLGIPQKDLLESPNIETLRPSLPKILDYAIRCGYITRIKNNISPEIINQIKIELRKNNKAAHRAYTQGAMFGLFTKIDFIPELGWKIGEYLTRQDGGKVALTTKIAADIAREEEVKINLGKL